MREDGLATEAVLVIGAGVMGAGIAQVAAECGHDVLLFDARPGAASAAQSELEQRWAGQVQNGKISLADAARAVERLHPIDDLAKASGAGLVIEAIVEDLEAKRSVLRRAAEVVSEETILASNTSSVSISAIANGLARPERVVGMHFFNPVPRMKLVEVVSGLQTDEAVVRMVVSLAASWGKTPVRSRSTPGFIVNRIARPFYGETWSLLQEKATTPLVIDQCVRAAGFRMGPCALMDVIGHDVNLAVTRSVQERFFGDMRYQPSPMQAELVEGGMYGRKTGRGLFVYPDTSAGNAKQIDSVCPQRIAELYVNGGGPLADQWFHVLQLNGYSPRRSAEAGWLGLRVGEAQIRMTDGRPATLLAISSAQPRIAVFDLLLPSAAEGASVAYSVPGNSGSDWEQEVGSWLQALGYQGMQIADTPGLVVARMVSMIVNEAVEVVRQGVCSAGDADAAVVLGLNYPAGPFSWLEQLGAIHILQILDHLMDCYRSDRYRPSFGLRQRAWACALGPLQLSRVA